MKFTQIQENFDRALAAASDSGYAGYDPYDALNTSWGFLKVGKWPPVLFIQVMKRLPINVRPLFGIKKGHNPKGIGLFLEACALMQKNGVGNYQKQIDTLIDLLDSLKTPGYSGTCWGYNFDWASPVKVLPKGSPTVVVTGFISKALYEAARGLSNAKAEQLFRDIEPFISKDLPQFTDHTGRCISYSTVEKDCCFNASILAAGYYARLYTLTNNPEHAKWARQLVDFVVYRQKADGHWTYSIDLKTGRERTQTDFHQGFILDSMFEVMEYLGEKPQHWMTALNNGAYFYFSKQFSAAGRSYFRLPKKYPTDVHHQAQGIITACKLSNHDEKYLQHADRIGQWALKNMFHGRKFIYRKHAWFTDSINYMRWGQAWMVLALSHWCVARKNHEK